MNKPSTKGRIQVFYFQQDLFQRVYRFQIEMKTQDLIKTKTIQMFKALKLTTLDKKAN